MLVGMVSRRLEERSRCVRPEARGWRLVGEREMRPHDVSSN